MNEMTLTKHLHVYTKLKEFSYILEMRAQQLSLIILVVLAVPFSPNPL